MPRRESVRPTLPELIALAVILLVGTVLRTRDLMSVSLWFDESFCVKIANFGWGDVWKHVAKDNHPPLYFYMLKLWIACWGNSLFAWRSLSVLLGSTSILGAFLLVRESEAGQPNPAYRQRANQTALLAALGIALAVFQIEYSQEIRMYVLGSTLTLWSSWWLLRSLQQPRLRISDLALYLLLGSALSYTHYYGLFILAAQFLYAVSDGWQTPGDAAAHDDSRRRRLALILATFTVMGLVWLPWLPIFLAHRQQVEADYWSGSLSWRDVAYSCITMWKGFWGRMPRKIIWAILIAVGSFAGWLALSIFGRAGTRLLGLGPLVTFACAIAASLKGRNIVSGRYFQFAHALTVCGVAVGIQRLPGVWLRTAAAVGWLGLLCWLCRGNEYRREGCGRSHGYDAAVAYLETVRQPGETVLVIRPDALCNCGAYLPGDKNLRLLAGERPFPFFLGTAAMADDEFITWEEIAALPGDRLWVVNGKYEDTLPMGPIEMPVGWERRRHEQCLYWYRIPDIVTVEEYVRTGESSTK